MNYVVLLRSGLRSIIDTPDKDIGVARSLFVLAGWLITSLVSSGSSTISPNDILFCAELHCAWANNAVRRRKLTSLPAFSGGRKVFAWNSKEIGVN